MIRLIFKMALTVGILSVVGAVVPNSLTLGIHSSVQYFLGYMNHLNFLVDMTTFWSDLLLLYDFLFGLATFWAIYWAMSHWD